MLEAFQETHDEANRLVLSNNRLKDLNSWLEKRVKSLEEDLEKAKSDFEKLENHLKNASCKCDTLICTNCENREKKVHYLVETVDKLSKGKSNFENVLASQSCVFGKAALIHRTSKIDFQKVFQENQKNNRLLRRNNRLLHVFTA